MRTMVMVVASALACGPAVGDDEDSAGGEGGSGETMGDGRSSSDDEAPTSSTSDTADGSGSSSGADGDSSSGAVTSSDDASTGSACDAGCESLDEASCRACGDCTALNGTPWETDPQGQWCLGESVYLGCQMGACFGQTHTWCSGSTLYELDFYCFPEFGGLDPCEPPIDDYPTC